ncbi:MAG: GNAT family N-acetyltransferase [Candidatus Baldrarchaeia archaeon]
MDLKWLLHKNFRIAIYLDKWQGGAYVYSISNGDLIGTAVLQPRKIKKVSYIELKSLYIKEKYRNIGLGSILLQEILYFVKERGFKGIIGHIMYTDSFKNIRRRLNFYRKNNAKIEIKEYRKTFNGKKVPVYVFLLT